MSELAPVSYAPAAPVPRHVRDTVRDLRAGGIVVSALAVMGVILGLVWAWWSPPGPKAVTLSDGAIWPYEESETFVRTDGRFAAICLAVGIVAALLLWLRTRLRGPIALAALCVGGLVGALVMRTTGYYAGGGDTDAVKCGLPQGYGGCIKQLPVSVHIEGLMLVEAAAAVLVYSLCAAFAVRDDLGRRDPMRVMAQRRRAEAASVRRSAQAQDAGRDGDGAGQP
jgi:uncharacterized protein DUF2567